MNAFAKAAFTDADQRPIHHLQQLPLVVALAEKKFLGVGAGRAIGDVLRGVLVGRTAILLGTRDGTPQLLLADLQTLFECL